MAQQTANTVKVSSYDIPSHLVYLTGCSEDSFESYGAAQFRGFQAQLDIQPEDFVLEVGCGVGRLAIPATQLLRPPGGYFGIDIIHDSIEWCSQHITPTYAHFRFHFENVKSQIHNPTGVNAPSSTVIPLPDASVDKVFLSSVFTHMFPDGVLNYLAEFRRVLKPGGLALTTMFLLNPVSRAAINAGKTNWTFSHCQDEARRCWIDSLEYPEGAVAYNERAYLAMLESQGLELRKPIVYGSWSGAGGPMADGQDYVIFGRD